jgi:hypothetical protein
MKGVTSYYQHNQGGKGKYIEKVLVSFFKTCSLNIEISKLPLWVERLVGEKSGYQKNLAFLWGILILIKSYLEKRGRVLSY